MDDSLWVFGLEDIAPADQHVDACLHQTWSRLALHTAIDLYQRMAAALVS